MLEKLKERAMERRREEGWPGGLGAAQHMRNIPHAAVGEGVNASPKLPCHLQWVGGAEENVLAHMDNNFNDNNLNCLE